MKNKGAEYRSYNNEFFDVSLLMGWMRCRCAEGFEVIYINEYMVKLLGYESRAEFLKATNKSFARAMFGEDDADKTLQKLLALSVGGNCVFTYRVVKKNGELVWIREHTHKYIDENGDAMLLCMCIDISDVVSLEKSLEAQREELRVRETETALALEQMGKTVCVFDIVKRTFTMPSAYAAQFGVPAVLVNVPECMNEINFVDKTNLKMLTDFFNLMIDGNKTGEAECLMTPLNGEKQWNSAEFATIFDDANRPVKAIVAVEDTTEKHQLNVENESLRENERLFRTVAAHSSRVIYRYDVASDKAYLCSPKMKGITLEETVCGIPNEQINSGLVMPESADEFSVACRAMRTTLKSGRTKLHMRLSDAKPRWVDMRYTPIIDDNGKHKTSVLSFLDVTAEHDRELAYQRYILAVESDDDDGIFMYFETDLTADVVEKSGGNSGGMGFPNVGCTHMQAVDFGVDNLVPEAAKSRARQFFDRDKLIGQFELGANELSEDIPVVLPKLAQRWFRAQIQLISDPYSEHVRAYTMLRDVTDEKLAALDVQRKAQIDGMTGIYNKITAETLIKQRLSDGVTRPCALLIADLDNLKTVNDNMGHAQGDRAIKAMAETLKEQFRATDIVARIGGDEFLAFLDGAGNEARFHTTMVALMRRLNSQLIGENDDTRLAGSFGVAFGEVGSESFEELFKKADLALYYVKRSEKNDFAFYTPEMEKETYNHEGHKASNIWQTDYFDKSELDRLLYAVSAVYPLVLSVNLTNNRYYMMKCDGYITKAYKPQGIFDELVADGAMGFHPDDRLSFLDAFSRKGLLEAWERGEKSVSHTGRQRGDDGVYRTVRTDVIFVPKNDKGEVMEITLARAIQAQ